MLRIIDIFCFQISCSSRTWQHLKTKNAIRLATNSICFAEKEGFEPSISFRPIHTFQACSLNHSDISPIFSFSQRSCFCSLNLYFQSEPHFTLSLSKCQLSVLSSKFSVFSSKLKTGCKNTIFLH